MKSFTASFVFCVSLLLVVATGTPVAWAQNVGIGAPVPAQKLDVEGWIELGDETQGGAGPATEGSIRYNNAGNVIEYYDGTAWVAIGGGNTLDEAYDEGGAGVGRVITADTGPVEIQGADGLLSTGTHGSGATAPNGAGTRLVWLPRASAFRAGAADFNAWDNVNIGDYSAAFGRETRATGENSFVAGRDNRASGTASVALGYLTTADGEYSVGMGYQTQANADYAFSMGFETEANGLYSTALGESSIAEGIASTAIGANADANGDFSTAIGQGITVDGQNSMGIALDNVAQTVTQDNTLAVLGGNVGLGTETPQQRLQVAGDVRIDGLAGGGVQNVQVDNDGDLIVGGSVGGGLWLENSTFFPGNVYPISGNWVAINKGSNDAEAPLDVQGDIQLSLGCGGGCGCRRLNIEDCTWGTDFIIDGSDGIGGSTANGGDITLRAGDGESSAFGGDIILEPGNGGVGNGDVGINTAAPTFTLSVNGSAGKPGGGTWSVFSDKRLKKDISPYQDGLELLMQIEPVSFRYNGKAGVDGSLLYRDFIGVLAQDVKAVAPYMVSTFEYDEGGEYPEEYLSLDPNAFTYMLINATQEQQATIEAQNQKLEQQQATINQLEQRLSALEARFETNAQ